MRRSADRAELTRVESSPQTYLFGILDRDDWFRDLTPRLKQLLLQACQTRTVRRHEALFGVGDPADGLYAVVEGDFRMRLPDESGALFFHAPLGPGSWFGEIEFLQGMGRRSCEVRAGGRGKVLFLPSTSYQALVRVEPDALTALVRLLCRHAADTTSMLIEARADAPVRASRAIARLACAYGQRSAGSTEITLSVSQAELASLIGVSRQYVNTLIARWAAAGVLACKSRGRLVLYTDRLEDVVIEDAYAS